MSLSVAAVSRIEHGEALDVIARNVEALGAGLGLVVGFGDRTLRFPVTEKPVDSAA
ncbi:hypothetical protein AB0K16_46160 [Nonomuraea jabiensis]|uniref:hypothetical protein n=1 Tax=Nonomuraea jabiensis TaxID=882448 RepID=UPI003416BC84